MKQRRTLVTLLVGVNLLLFACLVLSASRLPVAFAQRGAGKGDYACVTAKAAGRTYDVLYVLDSSGRKLYAYRPTTGAANKPTWSAPRDLRKDFEVD